MIETLLDSADYLVLVLVVCIGPLLIVISAQAVLNLWLIHKCGCLERSVAELATLGGEITKQSTSRAEHLQEQINHLEDGMMSRLNASIKLLETLVIAEKH